jgi:outer membrane immunogenic protein
MGTQAGTNSLQAPFLINGADNVPWAAAATIARDGRNLDEWRRFRGGGHNSAMICNSNGAFLAGIEKLNG